MRRVDQAEYISWKWSSLALEPKVLPKAKRRCVWVKIVGFETNNNTKLFFSKSTSFFLRSNDASIYVHCVPVYDKNNYEYFIKNNKKRIFVFYSQITTFYQTNTHVCQINTHYCQTGTHFCQTNTQNSKKNSCVPVWIFLCASLTKVCVSSIISFKYNSNWYL